MHRSPIVARHLEDHPRWCDVADHLQYVEENDGLEDFTIAGASRHYEPIA